MGMPNDLILVRHGNSEGNIAVEASKKRGDDSYYTAEFLERHSSMWRLAGKGPEQARLAGVWLRENFPSGFDRYYTSEYTRSMETAALLGLPNAEWYREFYLRERDRGVLDVVPHSLVKLHFGEELRKKSLSELFWAPPGGESMATLCLRIDRVIQTLHRECDGKRVIIVCHGEVIWAFRLRLERMPQEKFLELDHSKDPKDRIWNGQIVHYSRVNPQSGEIKSHLDFRRMIRADDASFSRDWQLIERPRFSNQELLEIVERTPKLINE